MIKKSLLPILLVLATSLVQANSSSSEPLATPPPITIGEYAVFLKAVATTTDQHHLYNAVLSDQIQRQNVIQPDGSNHFEYTIVAGVSKNEPIIGLTEFEGFRYCNWVEGECLTGNEGTASTESGVYCIRTDIASSSDTILFDHSDACQHTLIQRNTDKGTVFIIITKSENSKTSPMMIVREGEEKKDF